MRISIFGLGYVGAVSCACLSRAGHDVVGIDISEHKVDLINAGKAPIVEKDLDALISESVGSNRLRATTDACDAVMSTDLSIVCVGTPSLPNGNIDLGYIFTTVEQIGLFVAKKRSFHTVVIRSTVAPGTTKRCSEIISAISGRQHGVDFGVASNPEFLREGTAVFDFNNPPYTVIGATCKAAEEATASLYESIDAPVFRLKPEESELIKYANNSFHALKVVFSNEIGNLCKALGVDGHAVMGVVAADRKLNLSPYYMKPGFAYGGSCLPKDVRALTYRARSMDIETPLLQSLNRSNELQIQKGLSLILSTGKTRIGFLGFAFKAETDDLRESPVVTLIETLIGKGHELALYDSSVLLSNLTGRNKNFIMSAIPHIAQLMCNSAADVISRSDVIVIGNGSAEFKDIIGKIDPEKTIIDLARVDSKLTTGGNYVGICW